MSDFVNYSATLDDGTAVVVVWFPIENGWWIPSIRADFSKSSMRNLPGFHAVGPAMSMWQSGGRQCTKPLDLSVEAMAYTRGNRDRFVELIKKAGVL